MNGLRTSGVPQVGLTLLLCWAGVGDRYVLSRCFGFDAGTAPGLAAVQDIAKSKLPTLGYGVTYAIGNVLLALWGSVMVVLLAR